MNQCERSLVEIGLETIADTHDCTADVSGIVEDDNVTLHSIEGPGWIVKNVADIEIQIKSLHEGLATRTSENKLLQLLYLGLLDSTSNNAEARWAALIDKVLTKLLLLFVIIVQHKIGVVLNIVSQGRFCINLESFGNELEEKDARQDFPEVHATLLQ